ncbi:hypothetical protein V500_07611 [Pseudogymnoascus sp. VKM F-4518 (FW-2643)]|nr:hypothetical protein V500_07611 [Pseudogymnoascus sp. VKM F-4518 (FW-2643)]
MERAKGTKPEKPRQAEEATPSSSSARGPTSAGEIVDSGYLPRRYRRRAQEGLSRGALKRAAAVRWRDLFHGKGCGAHSPQIVEAGRLGAARPTSERTDILQL